MVELTHARASYRSRVGQADDIRSTGAPVQRAGGSEDATAVHAAAAHGITGRGGALPHLDAIQRSFGHHDVRGVQAHVGGAAAEASAAMGAEAYATGNDVAFAGAPSLHTAAHEAAHVVQQRGGVSLKGGVGQTGDPYERHADAVADRVVQGKSAVDLLDQMAGGGVDTASRSVQHKAGDGGLIDRVLDFFNARDNEAALDEWEDYQEAMNEKDGFVTEQHTAENFQSTTGRGAFDVGYDPASGVLDIECRCSFDFIAGSATSFPNASAADLAWPEVEKQKWEAQFIASCSAAWSEKHAFHCQENWWEDLAAEVTVRFVSSAESPHFEIEVSYVPPGGKSPQSSVAKPTPGPFGSLAPGKGTFDSEDLTPVVKDSTNLPGVTQVVAVHEAGHLLGLGDEYASASAPKVHHSDLVKAEFGKGVVKNNDSRIMSVGDSIEPEHGVTFLAGLKSATGMDAWATDVKEPRPIPPSPDELAVAAEMASGKKKTA